jgi:ATP-dependent helicase/nuclease subunit A
MMNLPEGSVEKHLADHCADDRFDCDVLRAIAQANRQWGKATGLAIVEKVERWLEMEPNATRGCPAGTGADRLHRRQASCAR